MLNSEQKKDKSKPMIIFSDIFLLFRINNIWSIPLWRWFFCNFSNEIVRIFCKCFTPQICLRTGILSIISNRSTRVFCYLYGDQWTNPVLRSCEFSEFHNQYELVRKPFEIELHPLWMASTKCHALFQRLDRVFAQSRPCPRSSKT